VITAVDTSVLLDIVLRDAPDGRRSMAALQSALADGAIIACEVVWAEFSAAYPESSKGGAALRQFGLEFVPLDADGALAAGAAWRRYRAASGPRTRVIADFLIGAHAATQADRLLTRDRGFYRSYFTDLPLLDPSRA